MGIAQTALASALCLLLCASPAAEGQDLLQRLETARQTAERAPNDPAARVQLGQLLLLIGDPSGALDECAAALAFQPDSAQAHYAKGLALSALGRPMKAASAYEDALRLEPNAPKTHAALGDARMELRDYGGAAEAYQTAVLMDAGDARLWSLLGGAQLKAGKLNAALRSQREALRLNPRLAEAERGLARAFVRMERWKDAAAHFEAGAEHRPASDRRAVRAGAGGSQKAATSTTGRGMMRRFQQEKKLADRLAQLKAALQKTADRRTPFRSSGERGGCLSEARGAGEGGVGVPARLPRSTRARQPLGRRWARR